MSALKGFTVAAALLWAAPAIAADGPRHFQLVRGSEVSYQVHVTTLGVLHETIVGRDGQVSGEVILPPAGSPSGWLEAPVAGFDTGIHGRDRDVARLLGAPQLPALRFAIEKVEGFDARVPNGQAVVVGTLTANGHSQPLRIPVHYVSAPPYLKVDGEVPVHFSDFGIAPPVLGLVIKRAPDQLTLGAHLVAKQI